MPAGLPTPEEVVPVGEGGGVVLDPELAAPHWSGLPLPLPPKLVHEQLDIQEDYSFVALCYMSKEDYSAQLQKMPHLNESCMAAYCISVEHLFQTTGPHHVQCTHTHTHTVIVHSSINHLELYMLAQLADPTIDLN